VKIARDSERGGRDLNPPFSRAIGETSVRKDIAHASEVLAFRENAQRPQRLLAQSSEDDATVLRFGPWVVRLPREPRDSVASRK
jgi:hypothetical protein